MTTRAYCDGCGKEPERKEDLTTITITTRPYKPGVPSPNMLFLTPEFELCGDCKKRFAEQLPINWPRGKVLVGSGGAGGAGSTTLF